MLSPHLAPERGKRKKKGGGRREGERKREDQREREEGRGKRVSHNTATQLNRAHKVIQSIFMLLISPSSPPPSRSSQLPAAILVFPFFKATETSSSADQLIPRAVAVTHTKAD